MTMENENPQDLPEDDDSQELPVNPAVVGWGVAAVIFAILALTFNDSPLVLGAGFFAKFVAFLVGSVLGWIGALIGDAIRKFASPDAIYTSGGVASIVWAKLFWICGPQVIGLLAGVFIGCAIVLG
ncbi:hypothetical protein JVX91_14895 [Pseudomonas sp. PDNC002]|uniref:hypothetical protein n=1 Tax=Pseudomonas sp. PDNC002 TaxID=2811422 RepID=UPI001965B000|nr:hypothetical protein [Pseudomonas sp. PDNC002]QRY76907.1 hypothetical protein JVX91_14895 [Pseudomonas sp. PDNC002]